jgi:hypothetical protein
METKKKLVILAIVQLVVLFMAIPVLAGLLWQQGETQGVTIDRHPGSDEFEVYGWDHHKSMDGAEIEFSYYLNCPYSERVFAWSIPDGSVKVKGGCFQPTPTLAPTPTK